MAMDATDELIIEALRADARLSARALAKRVHLSAPAVAARIRRLEDTGVITGYGARIASAQSPRPLEAHVEMSMSGPRHDAFLSFIQGEEAVRACDRVSGAACYLLRVHTRDQAELDGVLEQLARFGAWRASIVISAVKAAPS